MYKPFTFQAIEPYYKFIVDKEEEIYVKVRTPYVKIDEHGRFFRLLYGNYFIEVSNPKVQVMKNNKLWMQLELDKTIVEEALREDV